MNKSNNNLGPPENYRKNTEYQLKLIYASHTEAIRDNLKERRKYFTQQLLCGADGALWVVIQQHGVPDCVRLDATNVNAMLFSSFAEGCEWKVLCISMFHRGADRKIYLDEARIDENGYIGRAFKRSKVNFAMKAKALVEELIVNWAHDTAVHKIIPEYRGWYFDGNSWDYAEKEDNTMRRINRWL